MNKNDFNTYLRKYINSGCLNASDRMFILFFPKMIFRKNAKTIHSYFENIKEQKNDNLIPLHLHVDVYTGKNKFALKFTQYLENNLKDFLAGAYLHGSVATDEVVDYSDLDALVILKDEVLRDKKKLMKAGMHLWMARTFMLEMDPLQHHGFFVMMESDLNDYSETYFPSELFRHSKSLFSDVGMELVIASDTTKQDYHTPFFRLCESVQRKIESRPTKNNLYKLKCLLSEFMLLPALYIQARDKKGIYKKFSFEEARKDFSNEEWRIMDHVSGIREQWKVNVPQWKKRLISCPRFFSLRLGSLLSPHIPKELKKKLNSAFYQSMYDFTILLSNKLK